MRLAASMGLVLGLLHGLIAVDLRQSRAAATLGWPSGAAALPGAAFPY